MAAIWIPESIYKYSPWLYLVFAMVMIGLSGFSLLGVIQLTLGLTSLVWAGWVLSHRFMSQRLGW